MDGTETPSAPAGAIARPADGVGAGAWERPVALDLAPALWELTVAGQADLVAPASKTGTRRSRATSRPDGRTRAHAIRGGREMREINSAPERSGDERHEKHTKLMRHDHLLARRRASGRPAVETPENEARGRRSACTGARLAQLVARSQWSAAASARNAPSPRGRAAKSGYGRAERHQRARPSLRFRKPA